MYVLRREQRLDAPPGEVFPFFADARNLERITPPWLRFRVTTAGEIEMGPGTLIEYRLRLHAVPVRWLTRIEDWDAPVRFRDVQLRGPYRVWDHLHEFSETADGGTLMVDEVRYELPLGPLGALAHRAFVRRDLDRIFEFRHAAVSEITERGLLHKVK